MQIIFLGTGNANSLKYYNTCFLLQDEHFNLLVDGGGGNTILEQLHKNGINLTSLKNLFITHAHTDHLFGSIWVIRMIGQKMYYGEYNGVFNVYVSKHTLNILQYICEKTLPDIALKYINDRIIFKKVDHNETINLKNNKITFFDLGIDKLEEYGLTLKTTNNKQITCLGDIPYNKTSEQHIKTCDLLMHEAFCLNADADIYKPYDKFHSTVKEPAIIAENYKIPNLLLYHTIDKYDNKKEMYINEAKKYYSGNIIVPDDNEIIEI